MRTQEEEGKQMQQILVFQQNGSGEQKIAGVRKYGADICSLTVISIDDALPPVIDDTSHYLPAEISADLVLDYLKHPDLSYDLASRCAKLDIPVIASGKKIPNPKTFTPPTCCGLTRQAGIGLYGERFGAPEFSVTLADNGNIESIDTLRGAPCGATWEAAIKLIGLPARDVAKQIGLEAQFFCVADPAGWDPIHGKSPVHFAGNIHYMALKKAVEKALKSAD